MNERPRILVVDDEPDIVELRCSQNHQSAGLYPLIEHLTQLLQLVLKSRDLALRFFLFGLRFAKQPPTVIMLVGLQGAGKTTLFHCITGTLRPSSGTVRLLGDDVTLAFSRL